MPVVSRADAKEIGNNGVDGGGLPECQATVGVLLLPKVGFRLPGTF